ncbi:MAG: histidinol-phosphatase HisJ family protein [Anaerolineae bacterium]|nr:histidinol-phosphatase HisJ family protein [Anaerolineae bacterium]
MAILIDYHIHTDNSFDSKASMRSMCQRAIELGITELAFTDHFNNHILDIDLGYYNPDRFFEDVRICRQDFPTLTILAGIEVGEPHRWARKVQPVLARYPYDVVLGSLHWVGRENVFQPVYFRTRYPHQAYLEYFEELLNMVQTGDFDILAHVDLPKRLGYEIYKRFDIAEFEPQIRAIWQVCIDRGITPEINTKALRMGVQELHPTPIALEWYVEMGGRQLTIGSDAHHTASLASGIAEAVACATNAGLTHFCRYQQRQIVEWLPLKN